MRAGPVVAIVAALLLVGCSSSPQTPSSASSPGPTGAAATTAAVAEPGETPAGTTGAVPGRPRGTNAVVGSVTDGDTIVLTNGRRVRLVQIDAPEVHEDECYGAEASAELESLLPPGTRVRLVADPRLNRVDDYGRLLRYVYRGGRNLNVVLVRRGAATVWFYRGDRGAYAQRLVQAARQAQASGRGLWGACPSTPFDTLHGANTGSGELPPPDTGGAVSCPGAIPWHEAADHVGERATVEGLVAGTTYAADTDGKPTFLNLGVDYPDKRRSTVVIWGDDRGAFPEPPEDAYADRTICATGTIELYRAIPEIEVSSPGQIEVVG